MSIRKSVFSAVIVLTGVLSFYQAYAHEGHDHAPASASAPHGGVVKQGTNFAFEFVSNSSGKKAGKMLTFSHSPPDSTSLSKSCL